MRKFGLIADQFVVTTDFDDLMPDDWMDLFCNGPVLPSDADCKYGDWRIACQGDQASKD